MTELKPCPSCGGKKIIMNIIVYPSAFPKKRFMECDSCHWCSKTARTNIGAKRKWNRRVEDAV